MLLEIRFREEFKAFITGAPSGDGRGSVIAMNFRQTLNAQHFEGNMTDPLVCTAVDCYEYLPKDWKERLDKLGYADNGKANFAVWTAEEYEKLQKMLGECISIVSELNRKTSELAANVTGRSLLLRIFARLRNMLARLFTALILLKIW